MSDTPRTDAEWQSECCSGASWYRIAERIKSLASNLERELAEVTKQRDNLIKEMEYIAHSGLSARHLADHAIASIKAIEGGEG